LLFIFRFKHFIIHFAILFATSLQTQKDNPLKVVFLFAWQRPTLTGAHAPTTIGAEKLNFRVRDGNGCDLLAIATRPFT
jgi:hypothetical protein